MIYMSQKAISSLKYCTKILPLYRSEERKVMLVSLSDDDDVSYLKIYTFGLCVVISPFMGHGDENGKHFSYVIQILAIN